MNLIPTPLAHSAAAMPTEIKESVGLYRGALVLSLLIWPQLFDSTDLDAQDMVLFVLAMVAVLLVLVGAMYWLTREVRRRAPWARWALLSWTLTPLLFWLPDPLAYWGGLTALEQLVEGVVALMESAACLLLFFGPGGHWFSHPTPNANGHHPP
jgi:hypothetical protein